MIRAMKPGEGLGVVLSVCVLMMAHPLAAQDAKYSISAFFPFSLFYGAGGPSIEQSIGTSFPITDNLSIPLELSYYTVDGFAAKVSAADFGGNGMPAWPAFVGDCLQSSLGITVRFPINNLILGLRGGGILAWSFRTTPIDGALEAALPDNSQIGNLRLVHYPGLGWYAGVEAGLRAGRFAIDLRGEWRDIRQRLDMSFERVDAYSVTPYSQTTSATLILQGLALTLAGSYHL